MTRTPAPGTGDTRPDQRERGMAAVCVECGARFDTHEHAWGHWCPGLDGRAKVKISPRPELLTMTSLVVPERVIHALRARALSEGRTASALARDALATFLGMAS